MSLFDDFLARTKQAAESVGSNIGDYLVEQITDPFITVDEGQQSDPGPGQVGGVRTAYLQPSSAPPSSTQAAAAQGTAAENKAKQLQMYMLIGAGALVLILLLKR